MKRLLLIILLIFSTIENSFAQTNIQPSMISTNKESVIRLEKGTEAPFPGYLFPEDKTLSIRKDLIELDSLRAMQTSYEKSIDIYEKNQKLYDYKTNVLLDENEKLAKAVSNNKYDGYIGFIIGVAVTSASIYAATKIIK